MQVAHLQTGQTAGPTAIGGASAKGGGQLAQRSVLGALLPESLLYVLITSGAGAFATALVADSDTPELVWTHRMRAQVLVPQVTDPPFHACTASPACACVAIVAPCHLAR